MGKVGRPLGYKIPMETRLRMNQDKLGKPKTQEHKEKIRQANLGQSNERKPCDVCGKIVSVQMLARWHNERCKYKS